MKNILTGLISLFFIISLTAQNHDYLWLMGYSAQDNPLDSAWGTSILDFRTDHGNPVIYYDGYKKIDFDITNACISNEAGEYLFSYNGFYIENANNEFMLNGQNMSESGEEFGDITSQGGLVLPLPDHPDQYALIHLTWDYIGTFGTAGYLLYYSQIDMAGDSGLGSVIEKKTLIVQDTLDRGKLTATRHANGRDWWILLGEFDSNAYYTYLLTPNGLEFIQKQSVGEPSRAGLGQSVFSPDGVKYATFAAIDDWNAYADIYDFDRCTGQLSNHIPIHYLGSNISGGVAFSKNSRYVYVSTSFAIYQYDCQDVNLLTSELIVAKYDGFISEPGGGFLISTLFSFPQLAPDGRIYLTVPSGVREMHVINHPDRGGLACEVKQHSISFPTLNLSIPNFPNYRLGPLDGSSCDTLGFNNDPKANYRYNIDSLNHLAIYFTDLSYYEPQTWFWAFGDGTTSTEINPVHTFLTNGIYEVCLTVSNEHGSHTFCRTLNLNVTSTSTIKKQQNIDVFPNPTKGLIQVKSNQPLPRNGQLVFYNAQGQEVKRFELSAEIWQQEFLLGLKAGVYFYTIKNDYDVLKSGKVIVVDK